MWLGFRLLVLLFILLPSVNAVKTLIVHKGFIAHEHSTEAKALQLVDDLLASPVRWLNANHDLPIIKIDIKYQDWLKLEADRHSSLLEGKIPEKRAEVNAAIYFEQQKFSAKVRLQGDMLDHVNNHNRWSLKFSLKKKKAIFSSRRFALVAPSVRINQGASLFAKALDIAQFDIISPQHIPTRVVVNGQDWGVMLFEQGFSQDLLATNNRTEGVIVRFDLFNESTNSQGEVARILKPRVLQRKTVLKNESLAKQRQIALALVSEFVDGQRTASDVFDAKRLGQYLAMVDLWGAWHAFTWNNWRFYYNPHTALLEPIQSDVAVTPAKHIWLMKPPSQTFLFVKTMLQDDLVYQHYARAKESLLVNLESVLIPHLESFDNMFISELHAQSPLLAPFDFNVMRKQAECWQNGYEFEPCKQIQPMSPQLHAHMEQVSAVSNWDLVSRFKVHKTGTVLEVVNNDQVPLRIEQITGITLLNDVSLLEEENAQFPDVLAAGETRRYLLPENLAQISAKAALQGKEMARYTFYKDIAPLHFVPRAQNVMPPSYIEQKGNEWHVKVGNWQIDEYIVTPENTTLRIFPKTTLKFSKNAGLMVFGEIIAKGTERQPIVLTKQDGTRSWSGMSVFSPDKLTTSELEHLHISYASNPKIGLWQPRGATYFVNGTHRFRNVLISQNASEDGLNIVNGSINIEKLSVRDAMSDAFDCDFCSGDLSDSQFINIGSRSGGDGFDISGSNVRLFNMDFDGVKDKAISVGERSTLHIEDVRFNNVNFGLVSKDDSTVRAMRITAQNIKHHALMSYSKKPIFGGARLYASDLTCIEFECSDKYIVELGSALMIDGVVINPEKLDVKNLYQTVMKSDKPK